MNKVPPLPFISDGCSGAMSFLWRKVFGHPPRWESACVEHDRAYHQCGTAKERWVADLHLLRRISYHGPVFIPLALFTWAAIRIGGMPIWPFCWRWNFGWHWPERLWYFKRED